MICSTCVVFVSNMLCVVQSVKPQTQYMDVRSDFKLDARLTSISNMYYILYNNDRIVQLFSQMHTKCCGFG